MAGTIVSTPALGASDWSSWITQQGLTDRGFMRLSLTNFSGTAASQVAGGGVVEVAGSIYNFATAETITLATGTASASVAVYFNVIPSAGGTTCTVAMDATAPVWSDAKQGFYASAASTTRVVGGAWIHSSASFHGKYLYTGENLVYCLQTGETRPLLREIVQMGEWNMDATSQLNLSHKLPIAAASLQRIVTVIGAVRDDTGRIFPIPYLVHGGTSGAYIAQLYTDLQIIRITGGTFDSSEFDGTASTIPNRGWVIIEYKA